MTEHEPPRTLPDTIGNHLVIVNGLDRHVTAQLVGRGHQNQFVTVPVGHPERFNDHTHFEAWLKDRNPDIYTLTDESHSTIHGSLWFRPGPPPREFIAPHATYALGMRLRSDVLPASHVTGDFVRLSLRDYIEKPHSRLRPAAFLGLWLAIGRRSPALDAFRHFGFEQIAADRGQALMVLSREAVMGALSSVG